MTTSDLLGRTISHYHVLRVIGQGGMGVVYEAEDVKLGRRVALKMLPPDVAQDENARRRFEREARMASSLNHPHICTIHEIDEAGGQTFIAMELLVGASLQQKLSGRSLPLGEALALTIEVCEALDAAHAKGVIHRDIKPANIFVTAQGHAKVLDFGLAKIVRLPGDATLSAAPNLTHPGNAVGTLAYMSPEQARGEDLDLRSDLFSVGAVLYEACTGRAPFSGATVAVIYDAILNRAPQPPCSLNPQLPPELDFIVNKALEKDAKFRYPSAAELRTDLLRLQRGSASAETRSAAPARAQRPGRRMLSLAAAAGIALLMYAAVVYLPRLRKQEKSAGISREEYVQLTDFNDSAIAPALSPDGRILAFIRSGSFADSVVSGQLYVKMLPDGEPVQLTNDTLGKQAPAFAPDGSRIAYTTVDRNFGWDTWEVPVLGGSPRLFLANASGLSWISDKEIIFSEIKQGIHMGIVIADKEGGGHRDIYLPAGQASMAHRSALSPDGRWVLVVEMDGTGWLPCRLVPSEGSSAGRSAGPLEGQCVTANWSPDGRWMYFSSNRGGSFHLWRQSYPDGEPEQITFGPTEEEGTTLTPDGKHLIASVGVRQASIWLHRGEGEQQLTSVGFVLLPTVAAAGDKMYYLQRSGTSRDYVSGELWSMVFASGQKQRAMPGYLMSNYSISQDGARVVFTSPERGTGNGIWIADLDRRTPPRQLTRGGEFRAFFGAPGEILYLSQGEVRHLFRMREDGSGTEMVMPDALDFLVGVSPDGRMAAVTQPQAAGKIGVNVAIFPTHGGKPFLACSGCIPGSGPGRLQAPVLNWSPDGKYIYLSLQYFGQHTRKSVILPYRADQPLEKLWPAGDESEKDFASLSGARIIAEQNIFPGADPARYLVWRWTTHSNLYRIPIPE